MTTTVQLDLESLYNGQVPHEVESATSHEAAVTLSAYRRATLIARVLQAICHAGERGMTDDELQVVLDLKSQTQSPRRRELELSGLVVDSGGTRTTRNGRPAVVWVATSAGVVIWHRATAGGFVRLTEDVLSKMTAAIAELRKKTGSAKLPHQHKWRYQTSPNLYTPVICPNCSWKWLAGSVEAKAD